MTKKKSIEDIFDDDEFGLLDSKSKTSNIKSDEDRLIDSFEEINTFYQNNTREPGKESMSEYSLYARLKHFRENESHKKILKPFDRFNLLGHVDIDQPSIEEIINDDEDLDLLATDKELSIFNLKNLPKQEERSEPDYVAQRKPMEEKTFLPYENEFQKVHQELKEGKREIKPFKNIEKNLIVGNYYLMDGLLLYLQSADLAEEIIELKSGNRKRKDGRTMTIFENGTYSNMLFRSLGKQIQKNGKLITKTDEETHNELFINANLVKEEDIPSGWIYILRSKSKNPEISSIENLYKIGFSKTTVEDRIKNARNEATYLFSDVQKVVSYKCYNHNADRLEQLIHRLFAKACLDVDLLDDQGRRITPREWFVVPLEVIEEAIQLILNGTVLQYEYDVKKQVLKFKT